MQRSPARAIALMLICVLASATPSAAQTRVACVGDSITEGYGLGSPAVDAYPAQLQGLLGADYEVSNFGVSGSTARKQGDKPYWNQAAFTQSGEFAPNIVLLMLGTNDAKPANWNESSFRGDYEELVDHYRELGATVVVAPPPKVFGAGAFDIDPAVVNDVLVPLVRELGTELDAPVVDVFDATQNHSEWFTDTVHPSREGAAAIAEAFAQGVRELDSQQTAEPQGDAGSPAPTTDPPSDTATSTSEPAQTRPRDETTSGASNGNSSGVTATNTSALESGRPAESGTSASHATTQPTALSPSGDGSVAPTQNTNVTSDTSADPQPSTSAPVATSTKPSAGCSVAQRTQTRRVAATHFGLWLAAALSLGLARRKRSSSMFR